MITKKSSPSFFTKFQEHYQVLIFIENNFIFLLFLLVTGAFPTKEQPKTATPGKGRQPAASRIEHNASQTQTSRAANSAREQITQKCQELFKDERPSNPCFQAFNKLHVEHIVRTLHQKGSGKVNEFLATGKLPHDIWAPSISSATGGAPERGRYPTAMEIPPGMKIQNDCFGYHEIFILSILHILLCHGLVFYSFFFSYI